MKNKPSQGLVIAVDGPDGVGKTEQVKRLVSYFKAHGKKVHSTRQSGGTPIGEELRKVSLSFHERPPETDLFISLAMGSALADDIQKRKAAGEVIVMDRSPLAVIAYNGYGSQLDSKKLAFDACEALFKRQLIDQLIFFTAEDDILVERRAKRGEKDYFEAKSKSYHKRVNEGYKAGLEFLKKHTDLGTKVKIVDATSSIDDVHHSVIRAVEYSSDD